MTSTLRESELPLKLLLRGKVRDVYEVDSDSILLVTTDRISAFDIVIAEPIPFKGAVLTQLTAWWLQNLEGIKHHMISSDTKEIVQRIPSLAPFEKSIRGRAMLAVRTNVFPIECVVRGYISGSGWKEYQSYGTLAEEKLPSGLLQSSRLPEPRFTPAIKAESGHDENISRAKAAALLGQTAKVLEDLSLKIYAQGCRIAEQCGLIIADTKFEFGQRDKDIILIDEVMTPDSSRFWASDLYQPGITPPSFDKQPVRDYLEVERVAGRWDGEAPAPALPPEVVEATSARYLDAYERITGRPLLGSGLI